MPYNIIAVSYIDLMAGVLGADSPASEYKPLAEIVHAESDLADVEA
jgi:hypothetical protein